MKKSSTWLVLWFVMTMLLWFGDVGGDKIELGILVFLLFAIARIECLIELTKK